jgi:hypothetical protein
MPPGQRPPAGGFRDQRAFGRRRRGGLDIGSIIGQIAGGGVDGAIVMIIVAFIRQAMAK